MKKSFFLIFLSLFFFILQGYGQAPVANFSADIVSGCAPLVVKFTDLSSNNPTSWKWDLGNGAIADVQNPGTTFINPGNYTITLTSTNASGTNTATKTAYIKVNALPTVNFMSRDTIGCLPFVSRFTDQSVAESGTITQWEWNFGDGSKSTVQSPAHTYTNAGSFGVFLKVTNSFGCSNIASKSQYVKVSDTVHADFTSSTPNFCKLPVGISFTNTSSAAGPITYNWSFGDGGTSSTTNPVNSFTAYGNYVVTLVAANEAGCKDTMTKAINLPFKTTSYKGPDSLCVGTAGAFSINVSPEPVSILWNMGDGTNYNSALVNHTYRQAGVYTVRTIINFENCSDTLINQVVATNITSLAFSALDVTNCKAPFSVTFNNTDVGATNWFWEFGDGSTSTMKNPVHTYTAEGLFSVTLTATNTTGCSAKLSKANFITIRKPVITLRNVPGGGCLPYSFTPVFTVDNVDSIITYRWEFGDGGVSTLQSPTYIYNNVGTYTLKLFTTTRDGCSDSLIRTNGINTGTPSSVDFSVSPPVVCGKANVSFTAIADPSAQKFEWDFGDGVLSTLKNPLHSYKDTGFYTVSLTIESAGCKTLFTKANAVKVQLPISQFTAKKNCTDKRSVAFINESIGAIDNEWNFGDGITSSEVAPVHLYSASGEYTVRLITTNGGCKDTITKKVPVWLEATQVTFSRDSLCLNERSVIQMIHPNPKAVREYYWNAEAPVNTVFTRSVQSPLGWDFRRAGNFDFVGYTVDSFGCRDTVVRPGAIHVFGSKAYFDVDQKQGCLNSAANFIDTSKTSNNNPIVKWSWNFGDGTTKDFTSAPFTHGYINTGIYTVKLKITDQFGCTDSIAKVDYISRSEASAAFSSVDSFTCFNRPIQFINNSTGNIVSTMWHFGDGTNLSDLQPAHSYVDSGTYSVKLVITGLNGCIDSMQKINYVTVKNPKAAFRVSDTLVSCPPVEISFFDSSYYVRKYEWSFDDGNSSSLKNPVNAYFIPNNYIVKLKVTSAGGCEDSAFVSIRIAGPTGELTYAPVQGCAPLAVNFKATTLGATNFTWDYGNGVSEDVTDSLINYTYTSNGSYVPTVLLKDRSGCVIPFTGKDTIIVDDFTAAFGAGNKILCDSGFIQFTDSITSPSNRLSYAWDFGDGTFSTGKNPNHFYNQAGVYAVKLTIASTFGCSDEVTYPDFIKVASSPDPVIIANNAACAEGIITFEAQVSNPLAITNWEWVFGNGQTSARQVPPQQTFTRSGTFNNSLTVTNYEGCSATASQQSIIYLAPPLLATTDTVICRGDSMQLNVSGLASYTWEPATGLSCDTCSNIKVSPAADTWYIIKGDLSISGCSIADSILIKVMQPHTLTTINDVNLCTIQPVQLQAFGSPNYMWSPAGGLSSVNISNPIANVNTNTTYKVIGYDSLGCFIDSAFVAIKIFGYPTVNIGPDVTLAAGNIYTFNPTISQDVTSYKWTPIAGLSCTNCPAPVLTAAYNSTYTLAVSNAAGCEASDSMQVFVSCDKSTVFIPNTFSPNGDGMNDYFYPRGKGIHAIEYLVVFNRWGLKVFEKRGISANRESDGWNGTINGKKADSGVYTYYMEARCSNNQVFKYSGNITLIQ